MYMQVSNYLIIQGGLFTPGKRPATYGRFPIQLIC